MINYKTALISVYNKDGVVDFAKELKNLGWQIYASAGTAKILNKKGVKVKDVADVARGKAILGHRVVTLSRKIHAGLLARNKKEDLNQLKKLNIPWIGLVCVDLYPLEEEIKKPDSTPQSVIKNTDIGGPALLRSGAKGRRIVVSDSADKEKIISWLKKGQPEKQKVLTALAAKAEAIVAKYSLSSARYHSQNNYDGWIGKSKMDCFYGENPWQEKASLFRNNALDDLDVAGFQIIEGLDLSYNNLCDIDRLLQSITHIAAGFDLNRNFVPNIAISVKHGNVCGASFGENSESVLKRMIGSDPRAIFGGLVMTNFKIQPKEAKILTNYLISNSKKRILDGILAPAFSKEAIDLLKRENGKTRLMINPRLLSINKRSLDNKDRFRHIRGGFLKQSNYNYILDFKDKTLQKINKTESQKEDDLLLAWAIGSTSNSNTITLVKNKQLISNAVAQQDRVGACKLAIYKAKEANHKTIKASAYSDSFFPFVDGPKFLSKAGIKAILASSGSVNDSKIIDFCRQKNINLYLIPDKKARGFFGH